MLFFRWLLDGKVSNQWWAGVAIGLSLVVKPLLGPLLLLPLLNRQWRPLITAVAVPVVFNLAAVFSPVARFQVSDPMNMGHPNAAVHLLHPRLLQQLDPGQRGVLRPADVADPVAAPCVSGVGGRQHVALVSLLPHPRSAVLDGDIVGCAADRVVSGAVAGPRATTR